MVDARRTFGPVVLLAGLAGGASAMAGTQPWFDARDDTLDCTAPCLGLSFDGRGLVPAANALGLVALACLGVLLVTRGRVRVVVSVLGLLASIGGLVAAIDAFRLPARLRDTAEELGAVTPEFHHSGWFWIGTVAAALGVLAWAAAVRYVRSWPEMGRRYDAPADAPPDDLWKAIDQGHDPTS